MGTLKYTRFRPSRINSPSYNSGKSFKLEHLRSIDAVLIVNPTSGDFSEYEDSEEEKERGMMYDSQEEDSTREYTASKS